MRPKPHLLLPMENYLLDLYYLQDYFDNKHINVNLKVLNTHLYKYLLL